MPHEFNEDGFCLRCGMSLVRAEYAGLGCNDGGNLIAITHRLSERAGTETIKWIEARNAQR